MEPDRGDPGQHRTGIRDSTAHRGSGMEPNRDPGQHHTGDPGWNRTRDPRRNRGSGTAPHGTASRGSETELHRAPGRNRIGIWDSTAPGGSGTEPHGILSRRGPGWNRTGGPEPHRTRGWGENSIGGSGTEPHRTLGVWALYPGCCPGMQAPLPALSRGCPGPGSPRGSAPRGQHRPLPRPPPTLSRKYATTKTGRDAHAEKSHVSNTMSCRRCRCPRAELRGWRRRRSTARPRWAAPRSSSA